MKRDSLFYKIFQQSPTLLFDLIQTHPANEAEYRFDSVEVKETSFRIDGVFLPPDAAGLVYFAEVQFQRDDLLYERMVSEGSFYFYRNRDRCRDYRLVAIYPSQDIEQLDLEPHQFLIETGKLTRIYLDRLGDISQLPIGLSLMVLTILEDETAMQAARQLVDRARTEPENRAIMDMISSILIYKFTNLSRDEVAAMLASNIQESRAYREIKAEGVTEGVTVGKQELVLLLLGRKLKTELSEELVHRIQQLSIEQLDHLAEALLDFTLPLLR
jgi:predicted transposase/invertase (TIGR01784 family)